MIIGNSVKLSFQIKTLFVLVSTIIVMRCDNGKQTSLLSHKLKIEIENKLNIPQLTLQATNADFKVVPFSDHKVRTKSSSSSKDIYIVKGQWSTDEISLPLFTLSRQFAYVSDAFLWIKNRNNNKWQKVKIILSNHNQSEYLISRQLMKVVDFNIQPTLVLITDKRIYRRQKRSSIQQNRISRLKCEDQCCMYSTSVRFTKIQNIFEVHNLELVSVDGSTLPFHYRFCSGKCMHGQCCHPVGPLELTTAVLRKNNVTTTLNIRLNAKQCSCTRQL